MSDLVLKELPAKVEEMIRERGFIRERHREAVERMGELSESVSTFLIDDEATGIDVPASLRDTSPQIHKDLEQLESKAVSIGRKRQALKDARSELETLEKDQERIQSLTKVTKQRRQIRVRWGVVLTLLLLIILLTVLMGGA